MALQRGNLFDGHLLVSLLLLIVQLDVFFQGFLRLNLRHAEIENRKFLKVYFRSLVCLVLFQNFNDSNYMLFFVTFLNFQISVKTTKGLMQLAFNWLNFFCISSIAFFKSSLSFWYIDWTFLTSFTWTKR